MLYIAYAVLWLLRFALGACVFSFLGVVVWRLPRRESVVKGRSHCPACGRTLSAAELLPCLSFLLQGGKCRGCGAKIPARDFCYIDDVIEPRNTRFRIIRALQSLATKRLQNPAKKHSNIPL